MATKTKKTKTSKKTAKKAAKKGSGYHALATEIVGKRKKTAKRSKKDVAPVPAPTKKRGKKKTKKSKTKRARKNLVQVKEFCVANGIPSLEVGKWVWTDFRKAPDSEIVQALKGFGFHKSASEHRRKHRVPQWSHDCGHPMKLPADSDYQPTAENKPWEKYDVSKIA